MSDPARLTCGDIVRLAQTGAPLPAHLLSLDSHHFLISLLTSSSSSSSSSSSVSEYAQSILSLIARAPQSHSLSSLIASLLLSFIHLFVSHQISHDSHSFKTLEFFSTFLDRLHIESVYQIVDSVLDYFPLILDFNDAQVVDLVPKCLNLARNCFEGGDYVRSVVDRILEADWSKALLVKMVFVVREFPFLDKARVSEFLCKVFNGMSIVDLQDLPSLVYQLLVLASKGFGKMEVIEGIVIFFGSKIERKTSLIMARQVEGTVLLHMNFAVKQDPSLGQEVIGLVRSDLRAFNHFTVSILLSIARVKRFSESSIGALKTSLVTAYCDYKLSKDCKWLDDDLKVEHLQNVQVVERAMLRAVNESNYGREHVVPSIVQFAFALLESVEEANFKELCDSDDLLGLEGLASQMIKTLFEAHDIARNEIIEQCKFRILSLKPEQSMAIIRLLGNLVHTYPYAMLEHVPRLKELLDYFTYMNEKVASGTVTALLPLTKFSRDLQDYAILVMRKAMFRQEEVVRLSAIRAIIGLILEENQSKKDGPFSFQDSSSQAGSSQRAEKACSARSLFQELSGLLQRCLYQQTKVKEALYNGLIKLVLVDPSAGSAVFDLLLPHFLQFYSEDGDIERGTLSCVKSENGKVYIKEPLDCLLHCITRIMLLQLHGKSDGVSNSSWACFGFSLTQENEAGRYLSGESFSNAFLKIREFLRHKKLPGILCRPHESQDGGSASFDVDKRKCCALVLSGIIEVVLNVIASELEKATDISMLDLEKELVEFVELHKSLERDANSARLGTGTRRANIHENLEPGHLNVTQGQISYLATSSIHRIMQMVPKLYGFEGSDKAGTSQNNGQSSLSKKSRGSMILSFVLGVCLRHIKLYPVLGENDPVRALMYGDIKILGPTLMRLINFLMLGEKNEITQSKREEAGNKGIEERREYLHLALICLKELVINCLNNSDPTALLEDLLSASTLKDFGQDEEYEKASWIDYQPTRRKQLFILKMLKPLFFDLIEFSLPDEFEVICNMIVIVGEKLPSELRNSHGVWSLRVCKEKKITNSKVAKSVATLAVSLSSPPDDLTIQQEIAKELLQVMGSETHEAVAFSDVYPLLNHSTRNIMCSCLLHLMEISIVDMDWAIKKLKTLCSITHKVTQVHFSGGYVYGQVFEENLYSRAESVAKVLASFALIDLKAESQAESFIRLVTKYYKHLAQMSKLKIVPKGYKQAIPSFKFQKLVKITCAQLTAALYDLVSKLQNRQQENSSGKESNINKIRRENKCIPDMIFQIEDYEKFLIRLSKVSKFNLLRHAKRSTARDFRIIEDNKNHGAPVHDNDSSSGVAENETCLDMENIDEAEKVLSPESVDCGSVLAPKDSESNDDVERDDLRNAKRTRTCRVVRDSDDNDDDDEALEQVDA